MELKYNILGSSSSGNAIIIEDKIMFDCGISYNKIKPYLDKIKVVCLTHIHSDHLKQTTVKRIAKERPTLKFVCHKNLVPILVEQCFVNKRNIIILETEKKYDLGLFKCKTYELIHDAPNIAYCIEFDGYKLFYGTDTGSIDHINCPNCDFYFVEANYSSDEELDKQIKEAEEKNEYTHLIRVKSTHLSQQQCIEWLYKNMSDKSQYIWIHQHIDRKELNNEKN